MARWRGDLLTMLIGCFFVLVVADQRPEDESVNSVGPSAHYAELQVDTFRRNVFSDDKDFVVLFYHDHSGKTQSLHAAHEKAAKRIKRRAEKVGLKDKVAFGRLDVRRERLKVADFQEFDGAGIPKMYLVRAGGETPVRIPEENLGWHDDSTVLYDWIRQKSSFKTQLLKKKELEEL